MRDQKAKNVPNRRVDKVAIPKRGAKRYKIEAENEVDAKQMNNKSS